MWTDTVVGLCGYSRHWGLRCGSSDYRHFETGSLAKLTDIGSTEASLVFISTVPLACTVVYGPTKQYGWITNDPDMSATATIDHKPTLTELKPDTEYHFRVQGVATDGRLFQGKDRTFRTVKASVDFLTNFAALSQGAKVIAVSSNYGSGKVTDAWGANSAIDGSRRKYRLDRICCLLIYGS